MSEGLPTDPLGSHIEAWDWLAPERAVLREGLGERLWPELGPAGRGRARELLGGARQALDALPGLPPEQLEHGRRLTLARWLEREERRLLETPHPSRLAELLETGLGVLPANPAVELDPALLEERLATLDQLLAPLRRRGRLLDDAAGRAGDGARAARRVQALLHRLEARGMAAATPALEALRRLAGELQGWQPGAAPGPPEESEAWRELESGATWPLTALLERVEHERELALAEAGRRAAALRQRWLGGEEEGDALAWLRGQLAQDPPRPEQLAWLFQRHLGDLVRHLGRLGLEVAAPPVRVLPGREPGWPLEPAPAHTPLLALPDLSLLAPTDLEALLGEWHHGLLPLLAAREGVPGRFWLRMRMGLAARSGDGVAAWTERLVRPEDLDAWAAWAGAWLPRTGWLAGDPRLRLLARDLEARELVLARADLELRLATRPPEAVRRRLEREAALPPHLAQAALAELLRHPGRQALATARRFELQDGARRGRRLRKATDADLFHLLADCAWLPLDWLRAHLGTRPAQGLRWLEPPPAVVRPAARPELLGEVEERLAALGRIRREDLEAGREFDAALVAAAVGAATQPEEDSAALTDAARDGEHGAAAE